MLSRSVTPRALRAAQRGYASASSASLNYTVSEASGLKVASRDLAGPVTTLAIVSKAGTRYQSAPGLTEGLNRYAFKSTENRSTLRIQRESELLGAELFSTHTREGLIVGAKFLRDDLPYFVELLAEVATQTKYQPHVFHEEIFPLLELSHKKQLADTLALAVDSAHGLAFHRGLGESLYPTSSVYKKYLNAESLQEFAASAYAKPSFAIVANGADHGELSKWTGEFFGGIPAQPAQELSSTQSKYFGGEERIAHASGNSLVLAFPGSSAPTGSSYKPEVSILAELLGGVSSIKWSTGFSLLAKAVEGTPALRVDTKSNIYSDAGLLTITLHGAAADIRSGASKVVEALKGVAQNLSKEDFQKAKALAKFKEFEYASGNQAGVALTGAGIVRDGKPYQTEDVASAIDGSSIEKVKAYAKEILENKASVSAVGDLYVLPYAEELGLTV